MTKQFQDEQANAALIDARERFAHITNQQAREALIFLAGMDHGRDAMHRAVMQKIRKHFGGDGTELSISEGASQ